MSNETSRRSILKGAALAGLASLTNGVTGSAAAQSIDNKQKETTWQTPAKQTGNNLNLIVLVSDTFRADNLNAYGSQFVQVPYLNAFAKEAVLFEDAYPRACRRFLYVVNSTPAAASSRPTFTFSRTT